MAIQKITGDYYSVIETNHVSAVRTGDIKAQYDLDAVDFATVGAENGMLLVADDVSKTVKLPTGETSYCHLHVSEERDYEDKGRKYFVLNSGSFAPKMLKLAKGDIIETNCVQFEDTAVQTYTQYIDYAAIVAAIDATTVFGIPSTTGRIQIHGATTATAVVELKAVEGVTLPNGENGIKFVVVRA